MQETSTFRITSLWSILDLEKREGFKDTAVIGGLDRFLERWSSELSSVVGESPTYSSLNPQQRKQWTNAVISRLSGSQGANGRPGPKIATNKAAPPKSRPNISLADDVSTLRGVTKSNRPKLERLGLETVRDLLYHFPIRHNDFADVRPIAELQYGKEQTVLATVSEMSESKIGSKRSSAHAVLSDRTGGVKATWFNRGYLVNTLRLGTKLVISGKVGAFRGNLVFENPEYETMQGQDDLVHTGRLVPVYSLVDGLYQRTLRGIVRRALDAGLSQVEEYLPAETLHRTGLMGLQTAISQMHYPDSHDAWAAARRRLAFDEIFMLQMAVLRRKQSWREEESGVSLEVDTEAVDRFIDSLPFPLTHAQNQATDEILGDLQQTKPMGRLLEGDVGSGKTVVATTAMLVAVFNSYQAAILAPTEILAEQHFLTITKLLGRSTSGDNGQHVATVEVGDRSITVGLLLGSLTKRIKDDMRLMLTAGQVDVIIGTHAVIQDTVDIPRLAVAVVDEQHRFGVMQRAALRNKGMRPHLLVMSATPIPRSLALTLYGELDVSIIDEMPPGRPPIVTRYERPDRRHVAYNFVKSEVKAGRQAFIVFPFIEESEVPVGRPTRDTGASYHPTPAEGTRRTKFVKGAVNEFEKLSAEVFPDIRLGLLHGRMALREKELTMDKFQRGDLDVLVCTPVVEVGIDVPNATVMLIEGADRFGLAQLHQFRGRVGRGKHQSTCILLADEPGAAARERLKLVERMRDGFELAEEDLRIRGPGDYLGTRQSGLPTLRVARISDQDIISLARTEGTKILEFDPDLTKEQHKRLARRVKEYGLSITDEMS